MKIYGMEKLSLVDYDGLCACTLFTGACPFRCPYCHNAPLVLSQPSALDEKEIFAHLEKRRGVLDGVVISGGEPTINADLPEFIADIKSRFGYKIKLDTSGYNPDMLERLISGKLIDYVAMDIKNSYENYDITVGIENFDTSGIKKSVDILKRGGVDYEFRTTLVAELHDRNDIVKMAEAAKGAPRYYLQKFTDSGNCIASGLTVVPAEVAKEYLEIIRPHVCEAELRGY